ncbi:MAG: hypothetical protein QXE81_02670, partial [Desulfurococcaceae archaeon]
GTFIQFILGLALGYISAKIFKYVLALIAILILGSVISVWSLESLSSETLGKIGTTLEIIKNTVSAFIAILIGPVATGFIIGVIIGFIKK